MLDPRPHSTAPYGHECRGNAVADFTGYMAKPTQIATTQCSASIMIFLPPSNLFKDVSGKRKAGKRKVADTGGGGAGPWKSASDDTTTAYGVGAPLPYAELSPHFNLMESASGSCGNGDAAFHLQKGRMSFITAAHACL